MSEAKKIASLDGVVFNYPAGNNALDRITLDFHQGEIIGLVGANGAGKTTLMKLLAGYMDKTDGSILLGGKPIEEYSNKRLNEFVTLVEQNPENQLVGPTVEDELARACRLMGYEGRVIREGAHVALAGRPNTGKSSLFNALAGSDRAIVTAIAGTTRDLVTELVDINGLAVTLVDTAGLRSTTDLVESVPAGD